MGGSGRSGRPGDHDPDVTDAGAGRRRDERGEQLRRAQPELLAALSGSPAGAGIREIRVVVARAGASGPAPS